MPMHPVPGLALLTLVGLSSSSHCLAQSLLTGGPPLTDRADEWASRPEPGAPPPGVLLVDASAPAGGDGKTWATAFGDIQSAIDAAETSGENTSIWAAAGVYVPSRREDPTEPRSVTFRLAAGVSLFGGFAGTESRLTQRDLSAGHVTLLSGDIAGDDAPGFANRGDNAFHVVTLGNVAPQSRLDGVHVRGGSAVGPLPPGTTKHGGAVLAQANVFALFDGPAIRSCVFFDNEATDGGAVAVEAFASIDACVFRNNRAVPGITFDGRGGGLAGFGVLSLIQVTNSTFLANEARAGGAIGLDHTGVVAVNCTFAGNSATETIGAILAEGTTAYLGLTNCILWENPDVDGNGDVSQIFAPLAPSFLQVDNCDIQGWTGEMIFTGSGNFDLPPQFVDALGPDGLSWTGDEDLRLAAGSPCVDAGRNDVPQHPMGPPYTDLPVKDGLGAPRVVDGDGNGSALADLGPFERG